MASKPIFFEDRGISTSSLHISPAYEQFNITQNFENRHQYHNPRDRQHASKTPFLSQLIGCHSLESIFPLLLLCSCLKHTVASYHRNSRPEESPAAGAQRVDKAPCVVSISFCATNS